MCQFSQFIFSILLSFTLSINVFASDKSNVQETNNAKVQPLSIVHHPDYFSFSDNDTLNVVLSNQDINRVFIPNDMILVSRTVSGYCRVQVDHTGAAYIWISPQVMQPFMLYFNTADGHAFSLFITPKSDPGKTLILTPNAVPTKPSHWEKSSSYQTILTDLMKGMINGNLPEGYAWKKVDQATPVDFFHVANLTPVAVAPGAKLMGMKFIIQNKTDHILTLQESYFYHEGVRAVALSQQSIAPLSTGVVYEVIDR